MTTRDFVKVPGLGWLKLVVDERQTPNLAIGDRVCGFSEGLVVGIDEDAVVVARRNANGRRMELVFVGDAVKALRSASRPLPHK